ncbi:MAG: hypothetical protein COY10_00505 [Candidatus Portnoybacteria bacterium CG_4_10_14_0_2_um_filter_43_36]|uniref:Radical SAM core domain-containing protein n=3 Tax=Candidatus Portnoyibacteriota TaxID=1817913 RepID=A0A2M7YLX6_9BACT|nr:MAG: hypothetical protein COX45_01985 [Candidatus Portnoybacteria bacterium CG23_combo_of_CG06-09_8_20_14_all_44_36]PIZ69957.1 MAG: hypothetical protein COY10_00505 [Candidatus Portnoybacteria bacterium CG_4_10_14_0_2_um_filter_43_36]PJA63946.1 MAG: hypothetical protein CO160_01260 [Candidatus Portnoybacteria bacterium CG_4_9_14_3_um_filter_43_11]PJE59341.1 MAG: hypothetical protein COU84_01345 [Candidatus Portnoybacteria bacterium CG10_big_fil_rev_8_21_14_0_10_43_39]
MWAKNNRQNENTIKDIVLAVTYQCNGRCKFCDIWKEKDLSSLQPIGYKNLPRNARNINITGGEPFLREDITEVIGVIVRQCPKAKIIISTNGFSPSLIKKRLQEILRLKRDIGLAVSLDGFGRAHEELRGFPGGFSLALETIRLSKELGIRDIKIAFNLSDSNFKQLKKTYRLSKEIGTEFTFSVLHNSPHYFKKTNNFISESNKIRREISWLVNQELNEFSIKRWLRAYFAYGMIQFLKNNRRILPDYSGKDAVFIDPLGDLYPSNVWDLKLGNLQSIADWASFSKETAQRTEAEVGPSNWMICTARQAMKKNWKKVVGWILMRKFSFLRAGKHNFRKLETMVRKTN